MRSIVLAVAAAGMACERVEIIELPEVIEVVYVAVDAGISPDAGFHCTPADEFCSGSIEWQCTFEGNDAVLLIDCAAHVDGGYCAPAGACPPGKLDVDGPRFACCDP